MKRYVKRYFYKIVIKKKKKLVIKKKLVEPILEVPFPIKNIKAKNLFVFSNRLRFVLNNLQI